MIFGTFIAMAIALYFGISVLAVLMGAALLQGGIVFALTRNHIAINLTVPVLIVALVKFLFFPMITDLVDLSSARFSEDLLTGAAYVIAVISLAGSTFIGLMGVRR